MFWMSKKRKMPYLDTDVQKNEEETDTEDIYDDAQREEMLDEDEITASENAFMEGREKETEKKKSSKKTGHDDSVSVELAKDEYQED